MVTDALLFELNLRDGRPFIHCHVIRVCLFSQSAPEEHNQEKKCTQTFAHLVNF